MCQSQLTVVSLTQSGEIRCERGTGLVIEGGLRIKDLDKNACPSGSVRFSHDMFDVFFYGLLCDLKGIGNFFIRPPLCQMLNYRLLTVC